VKTGGSLAGSALAMSLAAAALLVPASVADDQITLTKAVPNDVFLCVAGRHNPEREFLDRYWGEVLDALCQSGVGDDAMELLGSLLGAKKAAEFERLKERASQLAAGVDWGQLVGKELVFTERFSPPTLLRDVEGPAMMVEMVWLCRGSSAGAAKNYQGLVAILEAMVEEVNKATGTRSLVVQRGERGGAEVASVNMLAMVTEAEPLPLSVALRDDVIVIGLRGQLFNDVLALMEGSSSKTALAADPRFKAAFAQLPPPKDTLVFFDVQGLLKPMRALMENVIDVVGAPGEVYRGTAMSTEVARLNRAAYMAYQAGNYPRALELIKEAYEIDSKNSIVLYNLACFNALVGNKEEALSWLEKAVEGGFDAPKKIATDPDLVTLRDDPAYKAALARAVELAFEYQAEDTIVNSSKTGEAYRLYMQAWQAYEEKNFERGLKLMEQAYAVAPKDSRVLYGLACFHALLGYEDKALSFLEQAVEGGFCCPRHISRDPDLKSIRESKRYEVALKNARKKAAELARGREGGKATVVRRLIDRVADAVGVADYTATVESTSDFATRMESIVVLVRGAEDRPIYSVFGNRPPLTDFDRYLPEETASFSVSSGLDFTALYKFIEDSLRLTGPRGEDLLAKWSEIQKQLGVDVQQDVIGWIEGGYVSVTLEDGSSVVLIKVKDEQTAREKVSAAIEALSTKFTEMLAKYPALAGLAMLTVDTSPTGHDQLEGFENLHFAVSPQPVVWGVTDGHLILGTSPDAIALCLATARGEHPNIRENLRAMSEAIVPDGPFVSVTLTDRRNLGEQIASGIGIASMISGMLGAAVPEPDARPVIGKISSILAKLAPVARKIDFYKSAASETTFDGNVFRTRAVTHYFSPAERAPSEAE
jgi:tetratricopeptide (TPR) repeat protein